MICVKKKVELEKHFFELGIFPPISLIAFLQLTLRFDKSSQTQRLGKQKFEGLKNLICVNTVNLKCLEL